MALSQQEIDSKKMYELKLHEEWKVSESCYVIRTIGGWIYIFYTRHEGSKCVSTTFVPFDNEMMVQ